MLFGLTIYKGMKISMVEEMSSLMRLKTKSGKIFYTKHEITNLLGFRTRDPLYKLINTVLSLTDKETVYLNSYLGTKNKLPVSKEDRLAFFNRGKNYPRKTTHTRDKPYTTVTHYWKLNEGLFN